MQLKKSQLEERTVTDKKGQVGCWLAVLAAWLFGWPFRRIWQVDGLSSLLCWAVGCASSKFERG